MFPPSQILVSSDDSVAAEIANRFATRFDFRDHCVEQNPRQTWQDSFQRIISQIETEYTLIAFVTTPFVTANLYQRVIDLLLNSKDHFDSALGVQSIRAKLFDARQLPTNFSSGQGYKGSQDIEPIYVWRRGVSFLRTEVARQRGLDLGHRPLFYELDWVASIDIDTVNDWDVAVSLCNAHTVHQLLGIQI